MKLSCQETLIPGECLDEKLDTALELGFEAIELSDFWGVPDPTEALKRHADDVQRALEGRDLAVSSICGGYPMTFLAGEPQERKAAIEGFNVALEVAGRLGASGPILVPAFGRPQISDPWPLKSVEELEKEILVEILKELAGVADSCGTNVLLEPLNRYETHLLKTLDDAVDVVNMTGNPPSLKIMADFFHMNIEEPSIPDSLRRAGGHIAHVHLADSTRKEPGTAHTDFESGFRALKDIDYQGYMAFECALSGDDAKRALGQSVRLLKDIIARL